MNTIERLRQLMTEEGLKAHDISVATNIQLATIYRWLKTGSINVLYEEKLNNWLTSKGK